MDRHAVHIRAANPTFEDGLVFARYIDEAAGEAFRIMLGRHAADIIATVFTQPDHDYSFQHALFAEDGKAVVGMAEGFPAMPGRRFSDQPLLHAAGPRGWAMRCAAAFGHPLFRIHSTLDEGDFYLQFLAIDEGRRGQGIGSALIDAIEERARVEGSARLAGDVWARNHRAKRLYERRGMAVESRWPKRSVIPALGILRMTKTL
jgi:GNAT superfamily N-acetyltransferase